MSSIQGEIGECWKAFLAVDPFSERFISNKLDILIFKKKKSHTMNFPWVSVPTAGRSITKRTVTGSLA